MPLSNGPVSVPASTTTVTLLAPNSLRAQAAFYNAGTGTLYLALSPSASSTKYTIPMVPGGYYELPNSTEIYQGIVTGVWSATGGSALVTEIA